MTRYYYACPIKALYMQENFGVRLEIHLIDKSGVVFDVVERKFDQINISSLDKYYVCKESEHIFQKTTSDICGKVGNSCQIILRGDKQFFEPEVENENN